MKKLLISILFTINAATAFSAEKVIGPSGGSGRWIKIARIQNENPIGASERAQFSGTLNAQTWFGNTSDIQYHATFSFGCRGGSLKPLLFEVGDAAKNSGRIEWRIYKDTEGYHYLWLWQSPYSDYLKFDFQNNFGIEYWTFENPPSDHSLMWNSLNGERQSINNANFSGNVGIGTTTPDSKLTVAGKIHSQEVKVTVSAGADFVFQKDYNLKPLNEVAEYISTNKHLPEIASADEMKKNGLELGEMNIKLLQKIEELTLYIIEQNKKMEEQQKQLLLQNERLVSVEKKVTQ